MSKNMLELIPKLNEMERSWVVYFMKEMRRLEEYKIQAHLQIEKQKMMMEMMKAQQEAKRIKTPMLGSI